MREGIQIDREDDRFRVECQPIPPVTHQGGSFATREVEVEENCLQNL